MAEFAPAIYNLRDTARHCRSLLRLLVEKVTWPAPPFLVADGAQLVSPKLTRCGKTLECGRSGARALPASPEAKNTDLRNQGLGLCSWVPGLALKGHPGTTAEFFAPCYATFRAEHAHPAGLQSRRYAQRLERLRPSQRGSRPRQARDGLPDATRTLLTFPLEPAFVSVVERSSNSRRLVIRRITETWNQ
jgi:hypothetical protein